MNEEIKKKMNEEITSGICGNDWTSVPKYATRYRVEVDIYINEPGIYVALEDVDDDPFWG